MLPPKWWNTLSFRYFCWKQLKRSVRAAVLSVCFVARRKHGLLQNAVWVHPPTVPLRSGLGLVTWEGLLWLEVDGVTTKMVEHFVFQILLLEAAKKKCACSSA